MSTNTYTQTSTSKPWSWSCVDDSLVPRPSNCDPLDAQDPRANLF